jgi:hypothetical protein
MEMFNETNPADSPFSYLAQNGKHILPNLGNIRIRNSSGLLNLPDSPFRLQMFYLSEGLTGVTLQATLEE